MTGDRWFYHPTREVYAFPEDFALAYEPVQFASDGARLHGWFLPSQGPAKGTVIHCHGNAGNITGHFPFVAWMPAFGWNVLVFDYQGFGQSEGRPTRPGTIADANAAIDYARSRGDVDEDRLVLFGQSLGGAIGIVAAAGRNDLRGVAIEGAFADYRREARFVCKHNFLLWGAAPLTGLLVAPGYDPIDYVSRIAPTPTLFITGTADTICDYRHTLELHEAAGEPKSLWVIQDGHHTAALTDTDNEGQHRLDGFFDQCVGKSPL
jgi:fermentation-respiration switch protein FrsA (DUF1100 family)